MDSERSLILLFKLLFNLLTALQYCIFVAVILSWFPNAHRHPIALFFRNITEPFFALVRKVMPRTGMIDLSPIIVLIAIIIMKEILRKIARNYGIDLI